MFVALIVVVKVGRNDGEIGGIVFVDVDNGRIDDGSGETMNVADCADVSSSGRTVAKSGEVGSVFAFGADERLRSGGKEAGEVGKGSERSKMA